MGEGSGGRAGISVAWGRELHFCLTPAVVLISQWDICISLRRQEVQRMGGGKGEPGRGRFEAL